MGETCEICGREIATKATDPSSWCWRRLLENDHDVSADYECYKTGFEHLRSLYREWQDAVDRANDKAERAEADKEHAQMRWREAGRAPVPEGLLKRAAEELHCGRRGIPLGRNSWELLNEIEFYLGAREEDRRVRSTSEQPAAGPPSPALAQPPAPQEGLDSDGIAYRTEAAAAGLPEPTAPQEGLLELERLFMGTLAGLLTGVPEDPERIDPWLRERVAYARRQYDRLQRPAEPSAPQAVAAPPIEKQLSEADLVTCLGKPEPHERGYLCRSPSSVPAPPAPVSAPQDNENQLSGKGKA